MGVTRNQNGDISWGRVAVIIGFVSLLIVLSGIIWAGSKTDSKAVSAYNFTEDNKELPSAVRENIKDIEKNTKKIEKFDETVKELYKLQIRQEVLSDKLASTSDRLDVIIKRLP